MLESFPEAIRAAAWIRIPGTAVVRVQVTVVAHRRLASEGSRAPLQANPAQPDATKQTRMLCSCAS